MRIAIVNDLQMAVEALRRMVSGAVNTHQIIWVAYDGAEAVRRCQQDRPDLILMDLIMPVLDGVEATRQIMAHTPCAILLVTADPQANVSKVFEAMGAGALDVVALPMASTTARTALSGATLLTKIQTLGKLIGAATARANPRHGKSSFEGAQPKQKMVAIGASAGGPAALAVVLGSLDAEYPVPIVIVQHVDSKFAAGLAAWLNEQTPLAVRLAEPGDHPKPGEVLVAGLDDHLIFTGATTLGYTPHPTDFAYRPSVDVFFESAARWWRGDLLGVLLTGMGRDGANGLKILRDKGHRTIAQDKETSAIYGMPKQAAAIGAAVDVLPLARIGPELETFSLRARTC